MDAALRGSWSATRWLYIGRAHHAQRADLVAGLRGSVTMSLSEGTYVVSWDIPGRGSGSIGGAVDVADGALVLRPHGGAGSERIRYQVSEATLVLNGEQSGWDFDGRGEEPAEFTAVLVRL